MRKAALPEKLEEWSRLNRRDQTQGLAGLESIDRVQDWNQRRPARREQRAHIQF